MKEKKVQKTYRAATAISVNINYGSGRNHRHVRFLPLSEGGSVLVTTDPRLQQGLENHPRFGTLFLLEKERAEGEGGGK